MALLMSLGRILGVGLAPGEMVYSAYPLCPVKDLFQSQPVRPTVLGSISNNVSRCILTHANRISCLVHDVSGTEC